MHNTLRFQGHFGVHCMYSVQLYQLVCMRFTVPQFIDVEDKIFGPLTLKQAIYIAGSIGWVAFVYLQFGFFVAVILGTPVLVIAFLLAFVKVHGRAFINVLASAFFYAVKSKLYLWKQTPKKKHIVDDIQTQTTSEQSVQSTPANLTQSNLKKLAWTLDTGNPFDKNKKKRHS